MLFMLRIPAVLPSKSMRYPFFDEELDAEDTYSKKMQIVGMSASDGRVVYVTPTGERYHLSSECAGENNIATTLYDAQCYEYTPCHKCVY